MKLVITFLGIVALCIAGIFALKKVNAITNQAQSSSQNTDEKPSKQADLTAQDLMPIADIKGSVLVQKDGTAIAYVKVKCTNNSLLNTQELVRETEKTATALAAASSWPMKIIRLQHPVDSTRNIETLRSERNRCVRTIASLDPNDRVAKLRREYTLERICAIDASISVLETNQRNGNTSKAECYIALPVELSVSNERNAYNRAVDMRTALSNAGIEAEVLTGPKIMNLIMSYFGDFRTSAQNTNPYKALSMVRGIHDQDKEIKDAIPAL